MTATTTAPAYNPVTSNTNSVVVLGAIAREPELRKTAGANPKQMVFFTVAGEELIQDSEGKTRRLPFYEQAMFMGPPAEKLIALGLKAGDAVLLDGKFTMRKIEDNNGVTKNQLEIKYGALRRALGFEKAERSKDAGGNVRLVGGFARASVYGKVVGQGGELRYTPQGNAVFNFSINARASWKEDGVWVNDAAFVRNTVWGDLAVELAELEVAKGMEAFVEGRPKRGSYEKDGKKVYTLEIEASRVVLAEGLEYAASSGGRGASLDDLPPMGGFGGFDLDTDTEDEESSLPF